ncbi:hypothetical protein V5O39_28380 [Pseudomonas parakoreensis]
MSVTFTSTIAFISEQSTQTPPCGALICPSRDERAPDGISATPYSRQSFTT